MSHFGELAGYDFATWCAGEVIRWRGDTVMPFAADVAVELGGVLVSPGDYAYADSTGAVIIPAASVPRVLDEAEGIERDDAVFVWQIPDDDPARWVEARRSPSNLTDARTRRGPHLGTSRPALVDLVRRPRPHPRTGRLSGIVTDQAQLHGLLAKIRDLGATLLLVSPLDTAEADSPRQTAQCAPGRASSGAHAGNRP